MSLSELSDQLLTWVITYGSPMFALTLFVGALGLPVPGTVLVMAAGGFVRQGVLDAPSTLGLGLAGAVTGDVISYSLGRFARGWLQGRFGHTESWQKASENIQRRGGIAIYLTRWLVTPLAIPTNLTAGSGGYPLWRFLSFDAAGELTWLLLYGGIGYAFGSQWEVVSDFVSDFSGVIVGVVALGAGLYILLRRNQKASVKVPQPARPPTT
ncbi:MAG TPA: DedA family protein [Anaerolineae bacterium]|nr:DedA family protein [Anaerolineae bacterium]HMR64224.1 DedA family protein [Anaerolineae bacterium]